DVPGKWSISFEDRREWNYLVSPAATPTTFVVAATRVTLRRGFTLAELLVVLVILSILTIVAVQSLTPLANQARFEATQRTLTKIKPAVVGAPNPSTAAAQGNTACFVADAGRLPVSLDELITYNGSQASTYAFVACLNPYSSSAMSTVTIPCGWRGP